MAHSDGWRATLTRLGWTDSYLAGPAFDAFLDAERVRIGRIVVAPARRRPATRTPRASASGCFPSLVLGGSALMLMLLVLEAARRRRRAAAARQRSRRVA